MAWIESHVEVGTHWKTQKLMELTGMSKREAVGVLHLLWHFALQNCWRDGDLSNYSPKILGEHLGEKKDDADACERLITALHNAGFMKDMAVHDWHDFCGDLIRRRLKYNKKRRKSFSEKSRRISEKSPTISENSRPTLPNHTIPNHTIQTTARRLSDGQKVVEYLAAAYERNTGQKYHSTKKEFVLASGLVKAHGIDVVINRINRLVELCSRGDVWFSKDGWADLTIGKLSSHFNALIDIKPVSSSERLAIEVQEKLKEMREIDGSSGKDVSSSSRDRVDALVRTVVHTAR